MGGDTKSISMRNEKEESPVHLIPNDQATGGEELSVVVPAMNEELTVGEFVDWCKEGLADAGVRGQILIVDSSTDKTPEIALQHGAEVLRTPPRGLGRAYIDAIPFIRGKWIVMGDADLTYDLLLLSRDSGKGLSSLWAAVSKAASKRKPCPLFIVILGRL